MSDQEARIEITASSSKLAAGLRAAASRFNSWAAGMKAGAKKIGSTAAGTAVGTAAGNFATRGIDFIADQGRAVAGFENQLTRLQINAGKSSAEMDTFRTKARALSTQVGLNANDILEGTVSYVDLTGDVDGAGKAMEGFARIAQASGSSVADIATATAALKQSFKIKPEEVEAVFSGMISQGKAGAVTLKDFAGELSALAPKWAKFKDSSSAEGISQFGAAFQVARQGFGSASEAATGMEALMGSFVSHAKDLRKFGGINVFDKHKNAAGQTVKTLKSFEQIISAIEKSKLVNDPEKMKNALGGRKEAQDTLNVLLRARQNMTATGNEYTDLVAKGRDAGAVQRDLATYLDSASGKMATSWESVKNSIAAALTPERIEAFAAAIKDVADHVGMITAGLGKIADVLGGFKKAGADIRGAVTGENKITMLDQAKLMAGDPETLMKRDRLNAASNYAKIRAADSPAARAAMGLKAESSLALARQYAQAQGPGAAAKVLAARKYFKETGQKEDDWQTMPSATPAGPPMDPKQVTKVLKEGFSEIAKSIGVTLKIGDNTVAKSNVKATDPRRRS